MTKKQALEMIDKHKENLVHPVELLHWTWLRVIILQIPDKDWADYLDKAQNVLSR